MSEEEIRIKRVTDLSLSAKREIETKLNNLSSDFQYKGFAKIHYGYGSPLKVLSVDPIEGTDTDYFNRVLNQIKK